VLVPYPVESARSGAGRHHERMWCRRTFGVPQEWLGGGGRVLLHFGAVDHEASVWVNGREVGSHAGGFDAFSFDVTDALAPGGDQEVVVGVFDPTDAGGQPVGKQRRRPGGIWYTAASGIWQTVWLEPVPPVHLAGLRLSSDVRAGELRVAADVFGAPAGRLTLDVDVLADGARVASAQGPAGTELRVPVPAPRLWSPGDPFLYGLRVRLLDGEATLDAVESYAGLRSIEVRDGRLLLNGDGVFALGLLDQGYWPDGVLTAPSDEALRFDLEQSRALGFNAVRKHVKVEPERWYWWADRLGLLVWQDMPSPPAGREPGVEDRDRFLTELRRLVDGRRNHPSVVAWVVFNEGWGQFEPERVASLVRAWDPERIVDASSGSNLPGVGGAGGDVLDDHTYVGPGAPMPGPGDDRITVAGEFGGLGLRVPGHTWSGARGAGGESPHKPNEGFAYEGQPDPAALTDRYAGLLERVRSLRTRCGLSAAFYTQLTDVEDELNGLLTYDRQVLKVDADRVRRANEAVLTAPDRDSVAAPARRVGTPGLEGVACWPLDDGEGRTARDTSGHGHDARLGGRPRWADRALALDGRRWAETAAAVLDTEGDFSVAAWVRLDRVDGFATAVSQDGDVVSGFYLQFSAAEGCFAFSALTTDGPGPGIRALAGRPPELGRWYHLAGVRDASANVLQLYVDGTLAGEAGYCPGWSARGRTALGRGLYDGHPADLWTGELSRVHAYDRALTGEEIRELFASGR
jgi:hypothetical protein